MAYKSHYIGHVHLQTIYFPPGGTGSPPLSGPSGLGLPMWLVMPLADGWQLMIPAFGLDSDLSVLGFRNFSHVR